MDEKTPVGFCQYYDCYDANDMEIWYEVVKRGNTFSIDYLVGNESYLGKGYGKAIVKLLTETVWQVAFRETLSVPQTTAEMLTIAVVIHRMASFSDIVAYGRPILLGYHATEKCGCVNDYQRVIP